MEEQLSQYFAGEASPEEKKEVNRWRQESIDNAIEFLEYKETWLASGFLIKPNESILNQILSEKKTEVVYWPSFLKYAAAVVLLGLIGSLWYLNDDAPLEENIVFRGASTVLPDGSVVTLKEGASLASVDFTTNERRVRLSGKAFFEIERNEDRPFFVVTDEATIRVLGTSFLVNKDANFTEVRVMTGLVAFSTNDPKKNNMSVNIQAGEMGVIGNNLQGIVKRRNDDRNFLAWKDGALSFESARITEVIDVLKDVYGEEFDLPENLNDCRLTAKFKQKSFEEVIQIISVTFNWTYEINKAKVVLSGEGC